MEIIGYALVGLIVLTYLVGCVAFVVLMYRTTRAFPIRRLND